MEQLLERINKVPLAAKVAILVVIAGGVTAATYFMAIEPIDTEIQGLHSKQASLDQTLLEKKEIADNLNDRRREMDQLEQRLQDALTELPEKKDIDELLAQLNDVGKKAGLVISRVVPGSEALESFYARIPVQMSVMGNYHEIALFLQEVANMRRIVNINNIRLNVKEQKNNKIILSSDFMATTFRFKETGGGK